MKLRRKIINVFTLPLFLCILFSCFKAYALDIPQELIIRTVTTKVGQVEYEAFIISAYKITSDNEVGYCLNIDKDYPSGQPFKLKGDARSDVKDILIAGYPNKSAAELNLQSEDEAYFATQIVIWSAYEGYDVYKFKSANEGILKAIIKIYEDSKLVSSEMMNYEGKEYYAEESTQDVVMLFKKIVLDPTIETPPSGLLPQTGGEDYYNYIGITGIVFISVGVYLLLTKN